MNILLTGGTGYIGSHTAVLLSERGHNIILLDNLSNSSEIVVEQIAKIAGKTLPFIKGDIRDVNLVQECLRKHGVDAVIHFAGLKAVGESVVKPVDYYANNVQGAISLIQAMQTGSARKLVFSSSATVYGEPRYLPLDEDHPTSATNPYGRSKLHVEEMLNDLAQSDAAWRIACLRYFNPVGAHDSGHIGENPLGIPNNLMPLVSQVAAGRRSELSVFGKDYPTPDGTGVRDYIHVMDLAEGHAAALSFLSSNSGWHAINLGTGQGYSVLEIIQCFEQACGRDITYRFEARRPGDVAQYYANPEKARKLLNWKAGHTLDDMCSSTWRFQEMLKK